MIAPIARVHFVRYAQRQYPDNTAVLWCDQRVNHVQLASPVSRFVVDCKKDIVRSSRENPFSHWIVGLPKSATEAMLRTQLHQRRPSRQQSFRTHRGTDRNTSVSRWIGFAGLIVGPVHAQASEQVSNSSGNAFAVTRDLRKGEFECVSSSKHKCCSKSSLV